MKKLNALIAAALFVLGSVVPGRAEDERVKTMMQEALKLYSEKQYIQALDMFKQVKRVDPSNSLADEYIAKTEKSISEWDDEQKTAPKETSPTWDTLLDARKSKKPLTDVANAKDIIAARRSLVERMKNRSTNTDNIVQIQDNSRGLNIILFHDQLFVPGLQILRDEALPILENVATLIRQKGDKGVTIQSMARTDSTDPFLLYPDFPVPAPDPSSLRKKGDNTNNTPFVFQDIEATRSFILFTYLAQRSMGKLPSSIK
jgi:tetratricopeptide (TPR) repeat protein